jgi:hypothetical protein
MKNLFLAGLLSLGFIFTAMTGTTLTVALAPVHHGPGMRGYNPDQAVEISGVIIRCWEDVVKPHTSASTCSDGWKGHGVLQVSVGAATWDVTLPPTPQLREAHVSMGKMKPGAAITVSGFKHQVTANNMYASEISVSGIRLFKLEP